MLHWKTFVARIPKNTFRLIVRLFNKNLHKVRIESLNENSDGGTNVVFVYSNVVLTSGQTWKGSNCSHIRV